jgi:bifunctional DNA-binding transcriptional regulator/antitoxin component of YhaV-PrlF toxin-antitoxin module
VPTLNERSIIKLGKSGTLVVAIPRDWCRFYGLKPGDRVQIIADGDLTIRPLRRSEDGEKETGGPPTMRLA